MRLRIYRVVVEILRSVGVFSVAFAVYVGVAALTGYLETPGRRTSIGLPMRFCTGGCISTILPEFTT
jgi:hypothetical protein